MGAAVPPVLLVFVSQSLWFNTPFRLQRVLALAFWCRLLLPQVASEMYLRAAVYGAVMSGSVRDGGPG